MGYCERSDLYLYGLPHGALVTPSRVVGSVDASADTLELDDHGYTTDDEIQFRTVGGGSLPTGLLEGTTYYAIRTSDWVFQVAASEGGAAVDFTSEGMTFVVFSPLPVAAIINKASRMVDDMLPAHTVPLSDPVPDIIKMTTAELAAAELLSLTGGESKNLTMVYDFARKRVDRWARGIPVRGTNAPSSIQSAVSVTRSGSSLPDWRRYGGIG